MAKVSDLDYIENHGIVNKFQDESSALLRMKLNIGMRLKIPWTMLSVFCLKQLQYLKSLWTEHWVIILK
jgi:DNA-binding IclR family transcriptional regulator